MGPRISWTRLAVWMAIGLAVGFGLICIPQTENLSPGPMVIATSGREIHRHDFVEQTGWPWPVVEQHVGHWYAWDRTGVSAPDSAEIAEWIAQAGRSYWEDDTWHRRLAANPAGNMRVTHWNALLWYLLLIPMLSGIVSIAARRLLDSALMKRRSKASVLKWAGTAVFFLVIVFYFMAGWVQSFGSRSASAHWQWWATYVCGIPPWLPLFLIAVPTAICWLRDRPLPPPGHCQNCGYDLTGNVSGRCPECGTATTRPSG